MQQLGFSNHKYKTMVCKHFQTSQQCPMGTRCHFAHGQQELRLPTDPLPVSGAAQMMPSDPYSMLLQQSATGPQSVNYKTAKCKNFEIGQCKYGPSCCFAHGDQDLRQPNYQAGQLQQQNQQNMMQQMSQKITQYQLQYILYHLDQLKPTDQKIVQKIKIASELWQANNIQLCAQVLNEIVYRQDASVDEKAQYEKILAEAQQLASNYMMQLSQQQSQMGVQ